MRKLGRRLLAATVTIAAVGVLALGGTGVANASTGNQVVVSSSASGACNLQLLATWDGHGNDYAAARISSPAGDPFGCSAVLQRSTDGGRTWTNVSSWHDVSNGQSVTTYNYWDGAGYLCRVYGYSFQDFPTQTLWTGSW
jgi:hypothetical protein